MQSLQDLRSWFTRDFDFIQWIVFVFLGGAFNTVIWNFVGDTDAYLLAESPLVYVNGTLAHILTTNQTIILFAVMIFAFCVPVLLSILLTQLVPDKRIVPPLLIQILAFSFFVVTFYIPPYRSIYASNVSGVILLGFFYTAFGGIAQDRIALTVLGRASQDEDFKIYGIIIATTSNRVKDLLSQRQFRSNLDLCRKIKEMEDGSIRMRSLGVEPRTILDIKQDEATTFIGMAFFRLGRYSTKRLTDEISEYGDIKIMYLEGILSRFNLIILEHLAEQDERLSHFRYSIIDELQGLIVQTGRLTRVSWIEIFVFMGAFVIVAYFWYIGNSTLALELFALVCLSLASELPRRIRRRGE